MRQLIFFRVVIRFSQKTTQSKTYKVVTTIPFPLSHGVHPTKAIVHPTKKQPSFRRTHDKSKTVFRFFTKKTSPICETPPSSSPEDPISASGYADSSE